MTFRELFPRSVEEVVAVVRAAGASDLAGPTPCHDFTLALLLDHFVGTSNAMAKLGRREDLDPADPYGSQRHPSSGGGWQTELVTNLERVARAWAPERAWQGTIELGRQTMPAQMIGEMALAEVLLHGWDLARATGQRLAVPDDIGRELLRSVEETAELGRAMGAYAVAVAVPDEMEPFARAVGASGRDPLWSVATHGDRQGRHQPSTIA